MFKLIKVLFFNIFYLILLLMILELFLSLFLPVNKYEMKIGGEYKSISGWGPTTKSGQSNFLCDNVRNYDSNNKIKKILTIGDSLLDCNEYGSEFKNTIPYLMSTTLGKNWDVYNLSAGGWGTDQEYLAYMNYSKYNNFDYVILFYTPANDLYNNISKKAISEKIAKPYFIIKDDNLQLRNIELNYINNKNINKSLLYLLLKSQIFMRIYIYLDNNKIINLDNEFTSLEQENYAHMAHSIVPLLPRYKISMEVTKKIISKFKKDVEFNGSKFVLVYIPTGIRNLCEPLIKYPSNCIGYGENKNINITCGGKSVNVNPYIQHDILYQFSKQENITFIADFSNFIEFEYKHNEIANDCIHFNGSRQASYVSDVVVKKLLAIEH